MSDIDIKEIAPGRIIADDLLDRAKKIKLMILDVDGVLTDGGIYYGDGGLELKRFNVRDGMGITLIRNAGIVPFIITARRSAATARRAEELGVTEVHQAVADKLGCLRDLVAQRGARLEDVAFIGDDFSDLEVLRHVGLPIAVADAAEEIKEAAAFVTGRSGGEGAVREACEHVLRLNGHQGDLSALYLRSGGG